MLTRTRLRRALAALAVLALSGVGVLAVVSSADARVVETAVSLEISISPTAPTPKDEVALEVALTPNGETVCLEPPTLTWSLDRERGEFREVSAREPGWSYATSLGSLAEGRHTVTVTASDGCAVTDKYPAPVSASRTFVVSESGESGEHEVTSVTFSGTAYEVADAKDSRPTGDVKVDLIDVSSGLDSHPVASTASDGKTGEYALDLDVADEKEGAREFVVRFSFPTGDVVYYSDKADAAAGSAAEPKAATVVRASDAGTRSFDAYLVTAKDEIPPGDTPAAEEAPAEEAPPADEPPTEEPADEPPTEEPPSEEPSGDEPPADEPAAEDQPAEDEPAAERPPVADEPTGTIADEPTLTLSLDVSVGEHVSGAGVGLDVTGLADGALWDVIVRSTPQTIGAGLVGPSGIVSRVLVIPTGLEAGWHSITFTSTLADGSRVSRVVWFQIDASGRLLATATAAPAGGGAGGGATPAAQTSALAATGSSDDGTTGRLALLLTAAGLALVAGSQRRARRMSMMDS